VTPCQPWPGQLAASNMRRLQSSGPQNWTSSSCVDCSTAIQHTTVSNTTANYHFTTTTKHTLQQHTRHLWAKVAETPHNLSAEDSKTCSVKDNRVNHLESQSAIAAGWQRMTVPKMQLAVFHPSIFHHPVHPNFKNKSNFMTRISNFK